jgi:hypothetical protein
LSSSSARATCVYLSLSTLSSPAWCRLAFSCYTSSSSSGLLSSSTRVTCVNPSFLPQFQFELCPVWFHPNADC